MADYDVNLNGLLDGADELRIIQNNLRTSLDNLATAVTTFQNSNVGSAIDGYAAAQTKWNAAMGRMEQAVQVAGAALDQIREQYHLSDMKSANMFNSHV